jgi:outer membrane protein
MANRRRVALLLLRSLGLPIWGAVLTLAVLSPARSADLLEVYQRALQNDPLIREADARRLAGREAKPQALAGLLPQLYATGGWSTGETRITQPLSGILATTDPALVGTPFTIKENVKSSRQYQLQLTQTLFRWDRWANLKRADAVVAQAEIDYRAAELDLLVRVAQRYFNVLNAQDVLEAAQATENSVGQQLEQADKRFEVGLIAITDVQEARAARDQSTADTSAAKRTLATNFELLRELTGESFDVLARPGVDLPLNTPSPAEEDQWVRTALEQNLNLISSRLGTDIAREDVRVARAGHLPTLDLVVTRNGLNTDAHDDITSPAFGNRVLRSPADIDQRQDTIGVQVNFPIYSGGAVASRVREQVYLHRAARERLERVARETERSTRDSYLGVLSDISRVKALRQSVESNKTALEASEAGYEVGTRTAVDVLDARRRLFDAQSNYARARYDYLITIIQLKQAAGSLNRADLAEINGWLK